MKDMQAHLEKVRAQIAECEMIRDLAIDLRKRELFTRLADHFKTLAAEIERMIIDQRPVTAAGYAAPGSCPQE